MSRSAPERPTAVSSSPRSQRTELSVPTPRAIVAAAGRPALIVTPSAFVTSTLAIAVMEPRLRMPAAGATKMMPTAPALKALVARAPEPHSLAPVGVSVQSTIAILPVTPLTAVQAPAGTDESHVRGSYREGARGSFTEALEK